MFEDIISAPIFIQLPVFGFHLAVIFYNIEYVNELAFFFNRENSSVTSHALYDLSIFISS